jgi:hypothetical protein
MSSIQIVEVESTGQGISIIEVRQGPTGPTGPADTTTAAALAAHTGNTSNPHSTTKAQVGLGNVDNTSDVNKPVSTAQAAADSAVATTAATNLATHTGNTSNPHSTTKAQVGLGNVDNTSDVNKPVSTAAQTALDGKQPLDSDLTAYANAADAAARRTLISAAANIVDTTTLPLSQRATLGDGIVGITITRTDSLGGSLRVVMDQYDDPEAISVDLGLSATTSPPLSVININGATDFYGHPTSTAAQIVAYINSYDFGEGVAISATTSTGAGILAAGRYEVMLSNTSPATQIGQTVRYIPATGNSRIFTLASLSPIVHVEAGNDYAGLPTILNETEGFKAINPQGWWQRLKYWLADASDKFVDGPVYFLGVVTTSQGLDVNGSISGDQDLYIDGTISGNGSGITELNASNISEGVLPRERLIVTQIVGNANATINSNTRDIILNSALTAARVYTLPSASGYLSGTTITFTDAAGTLTATNTATLQATINGSSSIVLSTARASLTLISTSTGWTTDIRGVNRGGTGATTAAGAATAIVNGNPINPSTIGATTPGTASFTTLAASGVTTLTNATSSSSTTTGALIVTGGVGTQGNIFSAGIFSTGTVNCGAASSVGPQGRARWFSSADGEFQARNNANSSNANITVGTATATTGVVYGTYTVATFPATERLMAVVTDSLAPIAGAPAVSGGSAKALVMYAGTTKTVISPLP